MIRVLPFLALGVVACAVDEERPAGADPAPATFDRIQVEVFETSCAGGGCHDAASAQGGLILEGPDAYDNLMFEPCDNPLAVAEGYARVTPGDPDTSFLFAKLTDARGMGDPMPPFGALDDDQIDLIELWILEGASP